MRALGISETQVRFLVGFPTTSFGAATVTLSLTSKVLVARPSSRVPSDDVAGKELERPAVVR